MKPRTTRMVLLLASSLLSLLAGAAPVVSELRVTAQPDATRITLALTQATTEKVFTLDNPARVVIDLSKTDLGAALKTRLPGGDGLVKALRAAKRDNGDLRIVLDVNGVVQPRTKWLAADAANGPRLMLELPTGWTAPVATPASAPVQSPAASTAVSVVVNESKAPIAEVPTAPVTEATPVKTASTQSRDLVIAVDAGHGGEDPGALGRNGAQEKNVTLAIARMLKERIDAEPGMRAVLTRDGDYFVPLRERINRARNFQVDMFISIHADSVRDSNVSGSSVYTLSAKGATNEAARFLADRENAADLVGGVSLDDKNGVLASVLLDLTQGASMSASMEAASRVLRQLDQIGSTHHSQVQQAGFVVLKSPDIPSMLVETAFISNPREEARLTDVRHQGRIADAVLTGVRDYFYTNAPPGTRVAQLKAMRQARAN